MFRDRAAETRAREPAAAPPVQPPRTASARWLVGTLLAVAIVVVCLLGRPYLDWTYLKAHLDAWRGWVGANRLLALVAFVAAYAAITTLSLPSCFLLTVLAGALFGRWLGSAAASVASALGATGAFLTTRYLFRGFVERHWGARLAPVNEGVARDGAWYLLTVRLVPVFPYFVINAAMGLTRMRVVTFWWVSQLGMLPCILVYANAGTELSSIETPEDILSPGVVLSLTALALVPLFLRRVVRHFRP